MPVWSAVVFSGKVTDTVPFISEKWFVFIDLWSVGTHVLTVCANKLLCLYYACVGVGGMFVAWKVYGKSLTRKEWMMMVVVMTLNSSLGIGVMGNVARWRQIEPSLLVDRQKSNKTELIKSRCWPRCLMTTSTDCRQTLQHYTIAQPWNLLQYCRMVVVSRACRWTQFTPNTRRTLWERSEVNAYFGLLPVLYDSHWRWRILENMPAWRGPCSMANCRA